MFGVDVSHNEDITFGPLMAHNWRTEWPMFTQGLRGKKLKSTLDGAVPSLLISTLFYVCFMSATSLCKIINAEVVTTGQSAVEIQMSSGECTVGKNEPRRDLGKRKGRIQWGGKRRRGVQHTGVVGEELYQRQTMFSRNIHMVENCFGIFVQTQMGQKWRWKYADSHKSWRPEKNTGRLPGGRAPRQTSPEWPDFHVDDDDDTHSFAHATKSLNEKDLTLFP